MENITFIREILLPPVLEGALVTLKLIALSIPLGLILGILIAVGRVYGNKFISSFCTVYTLFFRGTPLLVQLFILCSGAYHSEYIRGAIQSIKIGQMMAAEALGMTRAKAILYIILPQALRRAIPGCSNEIIYLIKYTLKMNMLGYQ